jgi:hypothetical protein
VESRRDDWKDCKHSLVFVNDMDNDLIWHSVKYLQERLANIDHADALTRAFVAWLMPESHEADTALFGEISARHGAARTYRDVAILGYGSALTGPTDELLRNLRDGLDWLAGRPSHLHGQLADFCTDSVAMLGIALGIRTQEDRGVFTDWVQSTCEASRQAVQLDQWEAALIAACPAVAGFAAFTPPILDAGVLLALHRRAVIRQDPTRSDRSALLNSLHYVSDISQRSAALRLAAFMAVQSSLPMIDVRCPSVDDVVALLRALPNGLLRWTWEKSPKTSKSQARQWHIDHEYHFQNFLWSILGTLFVDAKFEEYKEAVGSVHPRLDIAIPSLSLVIEVKYWRAADSASDMIRQIAEDASLYLTANAPYSQIVGVIWDEARRTEQHKLLVTGLEQIKGVRAGVVISQPSFMSKT